MHDSSGTCMYLLVHCTCMSFNNLLECDILRKLCVYTMSYVSQLMEFSTPNKYSTGQKNGDVFVPCRAVSTASQPCSVSVQLCAVSV